jgi:hypothetical protein
VVAAAMHQIQGCGLRETGLTPHETAHQAE